MSVRDFLQRAVIWPGADTAPGWAVVAWEFTPDKPQTGKGKPIATRAVKTLDEFNSLNANWLSLPQSGTKGVWHCMGLTREAGHEVNGKKHRKGIRKQANTTHVKSIWLDIDVKTDPADAAYATHYHSKTDALDAVMVFAAKVGLPKPSAVVDTGHGLHIYWISETALEVADWHGFADGLKALAQRENLLCDGMLITDCARVLRTPGTWNTKFDPPVQAKLLYLGCDYNFGAQLSFLKNFKTSEFKISKGAPVVKTEAALMDPNGGWDMAPDPAFAALTPDNNLQAGIHTGLHLVDPAPIFLKCGFLGNALSNGGKDYDNPLWNLSLLCSAFMENGNALAHEISKGHQAYDAVETQSEFDRKLADRAERGIGYPSCAAIEGAGCKACSTCPLRGEISSPLNIRPIVTAAVKREPTTQAAIELNLPDGYDVNEDGIICAIEFKAKKDSDPVETWSPLFYCKIANVIAQRNPDALLMEVQVDGGAWYSTAIKMTEWHGMEIYKSLLTCRIKYVPENKGKLEGFFMSFLAKMHKAAEAQDAVSFGWQYVDGERAGFALGGRYYKPDNSVLNTGFRDPEIQRNYSMLGHAAPWHTAMSYLTRQKRPELEAFVATSFAAPLIDLTGTTGAMVSIIGESGLGKTYALEVGAAVWGHPKKTKEMEKSTVRGTLNRLGCTVNLPLFWDEVSKELTQDKVLDLLMDTTGGSDPTRLKSNIQMQERKTWSTIVGINGNRSFRDLIVKRQKDHGAGLNRVLEYVVTEPTNLVGQVMTSESDKALQRLQQNYGAIGQEYSSYIATHLTEVQEIVDANLAMFSQGADREDRMWVGLLAAWYSGAEIANNILPPEAQFDLVALFDYMNVVYRENCEYRTRATVNPSTNAYAEDFLVQYLKERTMETIWTKGGTRTGAGRPGDVDFNMINPNASRPHGINVRYDTVHKVVWLSDADLQRWCDVKPDERVAATIRRSLVKTYSALRVRKMLAGGTPFRQPQEWVLEIDATKVPDLLEVMDAQGTASINAALGSSTGPATTPTPQEDISDAQVETGF